jgi:hypothetical protein
MALFFPTAHSHPSSIHLTRFLASRAIQRIPKTRVDRSTRIPRRRIDRRIDRCVPTRFRVSIVEHRDPHSPMPIRIPGVAAPRQSAAMAGAFRRISIIAIDPVQSSAAVRRNHGARRHDGDGSIRDFMELRWSLTFDPPAAPQSLPNPFHVPSPFAALSRDAATDSQSVAAPRQSAALFPRTRSPLPRTSRPIQFAALSRDAATDLRGCSGTSSECRHIPPFPRPDPFHAPPSSLRRSHEAPLQI